MTGYGINQLIGELTRQRTVQGHGVVHRTRRTRWNRIGRGQHSVIRRQYTTEDYTEQRIGRCTGQSRRVRRAAVGQRNGVVNIVTHLRSGVTGLGHAEGRLEQISAAIRTGVHGCSILTETAGHGCRVLQRIRITVLYRSGCLDLNGAT